MSDSEMPNGAGRASQARVRPASRRGACHGQPTRSGTHHPVPLRHRTAAASSRVHCGAPACPARTHRTITPQASIVAHRSRTSVHCGGSCPNYRRLSPVGVWAAYWRDSPPAPGLLTQGFRLHAVASIGHDDSGGVALGAPSPAPAAAHVAYDEVATAPAGRQVKCEIGGSRPQKGLVWLAVYAAEFPTTDVRWTSRRHIRLVSVGEGAKGVVQGGRGGGRVRDAAQTCQVIVLVLHQVCRQPLHGIRRPLLGHQGEPLQQQRHDCPVLWASMAVAERNK